MLKLDDLTHLPPLEGLLAEIAAGGPGLVVVAGLDPRTSVLPRGEAGLLPSGRPTIWRMLAREMLDARPRQQALLVTGDVAQRMPRDLRRRVHIAPWSPAQTHAQAVSEAAARRPDLLLVERLDAGSASAALEAAAGGLRVLAQIDTVFRGSEVAQHLLDLGVSRELLAAMTWVLAVERLPTLCPTCKEPFRPAAEELDGWYRRFPDFEPLLRAGTYFRHKGCERCAGTGREGEVTAFDVWQVDTQAAALEEQPSRLPIEAYVLGLAARGMLPPGDAMRLEAGRLRRTYRLLRASEEAVVNTRAALERRLAELEASNRVLQQRTEALISLESIGQALIASTNLSELAGRLCRNALQLCGADRAILYFLRPESDSAEVLAVSGWDPSLVGETLDAQSVLGSQPDNEPVAFAGFPPGVSRQPTDVTADGLRAALRVPFVAGGRPVGLMIVHTGQKTRFAPGEVALLRAFGNQGAVAIQRAGLTEALRAKIVQLEAAQTELVHKERLEREMELARQVQQSVLPRVFPLVPGYTFAARSEPARWVGGDFYDVILLDADRFGLVIGDVSDKGMPAALYMAQVHSLMRAEARRQYRASGRDGADGLGDLPAPEAVLRTVHRLLQELGRSSKFITVFYGVMDTARRRLTYVRAGHELPILLRQGEVHQLGGDGLPLGFPDMDELYLSQQSVDLQPGDRLVLYTDGLTDAVSADGRAFGRERLIAHLRSQAQEAAAHLCDGIFAELAAHQGPAAQFDDMSILAVEVH
jgi:serine phosphatase RsbU (regulator of sigma subunit)